MLSKTELKALDQIATKINFYQILKVSVSASEAEIREAFHREALLLHPDRYQPSRDLEAIQLAKNIYSKLVDAYRTLSSRKSREEYDQHLQANQALFGASQRASNPKFNSSSSSAGSSGAIASSVSTSTQASPSNEGQSATPSLEDENAITAVRQKPVGPATNAGIKFYKLAQTAYQSRDFASAKMNIQIALNTDPKNPEFLQLAARLESEAGRKK